MKFSIILALASAAATVQAAWPAAKGTVTLSKPQQVTGTFDCGLKRYQLNKKCKGGEGGADGAVFILAGGATLKNCIIGPNQSEGVHCNGPCTIDNVWWEKVCEDALTVLQTSGTTNVLNSGARGAGDKVIQHNGKGLVNVKNFVAEGFGKVYRSCGNCKKNGGPRKVILDGVRASGGSVLAGVNQNYGDTATIKNSCGIDINKSCQIYNGCDKAVRNCESQKVSTGFNGRACINGGGNKNKC